MSGERFSVPIAEEARKLGKKIGVNIVSALPLVSPTYFAFFDRLIERHLELEERVAQLEHQLKELQNAEQ